MSKTLFIILFLFISAEILSQQSDETITVVGDSLIGRTIDGETVRIVIGNVVLTQGDVVITCNRAIQYISRNDAELLGNVVVVRDSITINTERGFYYGNEQKAKSNSGLTLNDQKVILSADTGEYFFNDDIAYFIHNVKLYDTVSTLTSYKLTYFKNEDRAVATGSVKIAEKESIIEADSLEHFRKTRITFANSNVQIRNSGNNITIYGDHLEDYANKNYTLVNLNPLFIQIDTTYLAVNDSVNSNFINYKLDTLIIKSEVMESFRDTLNIFKAIDSVRILRNNFASLNDLSIYYKDLQKIITQKQGPEKMQPIIWYQNSQLTGDSVTIYLRNNSIRLLDVFKNAFLLSQDSVYTNRFNQLSGDRIEMTFNEGNITSTEVFGDVRSIYYIYEDNTPNGLIKSSSVSARINFDDQKVDEVRLYGSPKSEFYPENQVAGKELSFTLPEYIFYENRPVKKELLSQINKKIYGKIKFNFAK